MLSKTQYYLSDLPDLDSLVFDSGLSEGEIEDIVGRFPKDHDKWAGKLRGQVWMYERDGELVKIQLRHHFLKSKILWEYRVWEYK